MRARTTKSHFAYVRSSVRILRDCSHGQSVLVCNRMTMNGNYKSPVGLSVYDNVTFEGDLF
jgi:hypothetical protein